MKKFINESFFNPVIHVIPILTFLLLETHYYNDIRIAWVVSLPVTILFAFYVYFFYRSLLSWFLVSVSVYLSVAVIISFTHDLFSIPFLVVYGKLVAIPFLLIPWIFKKYILMLVAKISNKKIAMENNLNELIRTTNAIVIILLVFSLSFLIIFFFVTENRIQLLYLTYNINIALLLFYFIFQTIRVFAVRRSLINEEWVPIVNDNGKEIGSIDFTTSMENTGVKFMHPVARVIVMAGNKMLLRKRTFQDKVNPDTWDHAICTHVRLKESVIDAIKRSASELYGLEEVGPEFLSNYKIENKYEYQHVHLFLSCRFSDVVFNSETNKHQTKWWTLQQIQDELSSGIFTDNFIKEFELLNRSGLIDMGRCQCECKLRDEVQRNKP